MALSSNKVFVVQLYSIMPLQQGPYQLSIQLECERNGTFDTHLSSFPSRMLYAKYSLNFMGVRTYHPLFKMSLLS